MAVKVVSVSVSLVSLVELVLLNLFGLKTNTHQNIIMIFDVGIFW